MRKFFHDTGKVIIMVAIAIALALYAADFVESFHMSHAPEMSTCE